MSLETYENKERKYEKRKKQIGEKRGFYQPVAKYEKQANVSSRTSAKSSSVLKKRKIKNFKEQNFLSLGVFFFFFFFFLTTCFQPWVTMGCGSFFTRLQLLLQPWNFFFKTRYISLILCITLWQRGG